MFYIAAAPHPPVKALPVVRALAWATHPVAIVPTPGLEPGRPFGHWLLKPARLHSVKQAVWPTGRAAIVAGAGFEPATSWV